MSVVRCHSLKDLNAKLQRDFKGHEKAYRRALKRTAEIGANIVRRNVPVAFSELRDSVHVQYMSDGLTLIVADAPHAASVEYGSRPHTPPLEPLIRWVKLRGMQGLTKSRTLKRLPGATTFESARGVAKWIAEHEQAGAVDVDVPRQIAFAIQAAIAKRGTKPHRFAAKSVPAIQAVLDERVKFELGKRFI